MKTLVTIIDPAISSYCKEFRDNQLEYAVRHGYLHHVGMSLYWPDLAASFSKAAYIAGALENQANEVVIWADADVAFTNMTVDIGDLVSAKHWLAGYQQKNIEWIGDRPYLCAGLMVIRNCDLSRTFFNELVRRVGTRVNTSHPWEQWYVDEMLVATKFDGVNLCDAATIGGFSQEYWNDGHPWQPGYPTVHISTTGNWAGRQQTLVNKYLPQVIR